MQKFCLRLVLLLSLSATVGEAQKVTWSTPLSESRKLDYLKVIGQDENGFYLLQSNHPISKDNEFYAYRNSRFFVSCYNYDMKLLWEKGIDVLKSDTRIIGFISIENRLTELSSEWNKKEKKFRIIARSYSSTGKVDSLYKTISEEEFGAVDNESSYFIRASQDRQSILIVYQSVFLKNEQRYTALVCDTSLNIIHKSSLSIPLSRKYFNPYRFMVSNTGTIFLFGIKTDAEKKNRDPDKNYFTLFSNTAESGKWNEHEIKNPQHFLTDAGVAIDELNHKIVVAGFYSDRTDYSTAGAFYYNVDPVSLAVSEIRFSAFAASFLYKFLGEQKENYNRELVNYSIDKIILRRDGGAVIVAEANYTTDYSYYDYYLRTTLVKKYYHSDNIIQLSVNRDGTMLWSGMVQKEQTSEDSEDSFVSYAAAVSNAKMYCIFNRSLKRKTRIQISTRDALGNEKSDALFSEEQDVFILPSASKQVDENMLVVPAYKGKDLRLAGIIF